MKLNTDGENARITSDENHNNRRIRIVMQKFHVKNPIVFQAV